MRARLNASLQARVMPNPSRGAFTVSLEGKLKEPMQIRVTDITGRMIESRSGIQPNTQLQIGQNWKPGIYILQVQQGQESKTIKLVKE
jgi:hypothetical protein